MKRIVSVRLQIVRESSSLYETDTIKNELDAAKIAQKYIGNTDREHCIVICLDTKNKVNALHTLSIGTLEASYVHPREVFKLAVRNNSASIILAHNHPSGDVTPSPADIMVTERIKECGELMGIKLLDHIIVEDQGTFCSLKQQGLVNL